MWITTDCRGEKQVWYAEREVIMKETLIAIILFVLAMLFFCEISIIKKLDKLIELNTPEYINIVPEKPLLENK